MEIWDLHCHLSGLPANTPEARLAKLLEFADRMERASVDRHITRSERPEGPVRP